MALDGLSDTVTVAPSAARRVSCPGVAERENLAWRALDALEAEAGRPLPCAVTIEKRIPAQAGLGGGSSDAAAVLVAADRLHGLDFGADRLERVAARVGSDVPFFVRGGARWAEGRGERLSPAQVAPFAALLLKPKVGLSTAAVYRAFDRLPPRPPDVVLPSRNFASFDGLVACSRNDLWGAALALAPGLGTCARALRAAGAPAVLLCGSGSCVAGLFPGVEAARDAARRVEAPLARVVSGPATARPGG